MIIWSLSTHKSILKYVFANHTSLKMAAAMEFIFWLICRSKVWWNKTIPSSSYIECEAHGGWETTWNHPSLCIWYIYQYSAGVHCNVKYHLNSSPPGQNGRHFPNNILKCIFMNGKFCMMIQISLKFVPNSPFNNIPALVQIMAWHWSGNKIWTNADPVHWRMYTAQGGDEWIHMKLWRQISHKGLCGHGKYNLHWK